MSGRPWAVVTGASSGIGRALAIEFAAGGYHLALTGRNEAALKSVADECASRFHVETEVIAADLSRADETRALVSRLTSQPRHYDALVNNAGFGIHGDFVSTDLGREIDMIHVQLAASLSLTKALLPAMVGRRQGNILNVASVYAFGPVPSQAVYAACKAFLLSFSSALKDELRDSGVRVTVFCPGVTQTQFRTRAGMADKGKESGITAEYAARLAFTAMRRGKHIVVPGVANRVFFLLSRVLPGGPFAGLARLINSQRGISRTGVSQ
jgi:short-subunit dehydrogenase